MLEKLYQEQNLTRTENGALAYRSTGTDCLDLFSVAGAIRCRSSERITSLFLNAYIENKDLAMKLLFYIRDIHGGLGERRVFRIMLHAAALAFPDSVQKNLLFIPEYGRFDDCLALFGTPCEPQLIEMIRTQLEDDLANMQQQKSISLMAKWLPSVNTSSAATRETAKILLKALHMTEREYRTTLSRLRKHIDILESKLCRNEYDFDYEKLPSKALFQYRHAFLKNDPQRYKAFLASVEKGSATLHTSSLYPYEIIHQCLRLFKSNPEVTEFSENRRVLNATWNSLPDFTDDRNVLVVVDGSASMYSNYYNPDSQCLPITVAVSLAIYFAKRNKGKFHDHFITFSTRPRLVEIKGDDIYEQALYCMNYNEVSNTDLYEVFMLLLLTAIKNNLPQTELPETLYIISDMEFDSGVQHDATVFEDAKEKFEDYGYHLPNVVYWNVDSRNQQCPVKKDEHGTALVSGCTPSVFSMAMHQELTPEAFMVQVLSNERYDKIIA